MEKELIIVAAPHDVHPVTRQGACGQGDGEGAKTISCRIWL